jgi:Kef-type K+ transport system membrane component KefB
MKNTSGIIAKSVARLFLLLLLLAIIPLFQVDGSKLQHLYIVSKSKWLFVFPVILVGGFVYFFIRSTINKYKEPDINWLLVINTFVLMAYCATLFFRVYQLTLPH